MSTLVPETSRRGVGTATRFLHAAPTVAALFYPVALVAFYSGGRMVHDASTWETWLSGWIVTLGGAVLAFGVPAISFWVISVLGQELAPSGRKSGLDGWLIWRLPVRHFSPPWAHPVPPAFQR
jgi:hypothetical protein